MERLFTYFFIFLAVFSSCQLNEATSVSVSEEKKNTIVVQEQKLDPDSILNNVKTFYDRGDYINMFKEYYALVHDYPEHPSTIEAKKYCDKVNDSTEKENKKKAEEKRKELLKQKPNLPKLEKIQAKHGCSLEEAELIFNHRVRIGWSETWCLAALGKPTRINRTTTAFGYSEQWCYNGGNYLYFTNGVLTTVQN